MDSDEKRNFPRMIINCAMDFTLVDADNNCSGQAVNISSTGILFSSEQKLNMGDCINVTVPSNMPVNVLRAIIRIVRVEPNRDGPGYFFGGEIEKKLD